MIGVLEYKEMKNRDVGSQTKGKAGNQARTIWKAGSQCRLRGYNSTSASKSSVTTLLVCIHMCMYVRIYASSTKNIDKFYHIKQSMGLYVTSITYNPRHIFEKHKYLLLQWSSYITRNILLISTCHYATNMRKMTTEVLKLAAELTLVRIQL